MMPEPPLPEGAAVSGQDVGSVPTNCLPRIAWPPTHAETLLFPAGPSDNRDFFNMPRGLVLTPRPFYN